MLDKLGTICGHLERRLKERGTFNVIMFGTTLEAQYFNTMMLWDNNVDTSINKIYMDRLICRGIRMEDKGRLVYKWAHNKICKVWILDKGKKIDILSREMI